MEIQKKIKLKYSRETTLSHPLSIKYPSSVVCFNEFMKQEGCKEKIDPNNVSVISLDNIEIIKSKDNKCNRQCTCDFAIGIGTGSMLIGDAKFNQDKIHNLDFKNLKQKRNHSMELLREEDNCEICNEFVILVKTKIYHESERFFRFKNQNMKLFKAYTISSFLDTILD